MNLWEDSYEGRLISKAHSEIFCRRSNVAMRAQCVLVATTLVQFKLKYTEGDTSPLCCIESVEYPGILFVGGGSTNSVEDRRQRERGSGGGSPLVRGSGSRYNLVQEISFHTVKFY